MPGRHVRFSHTNSFHSPPPPLMSPSGSSTASSVGPLTPPSVAYAGLPGPTPFMQRHGDAYSKAAAAPRRAHPLLAFSSTAPPILNYDVSLHPSTLSTHHAGLSSAGLAEPAVYPPQPALTLATPHLPWSVPVAAANGRYVAVADVLNALYRMLRTNATEGEFNALRTPKLMRMAAAGYKRRCERARLHGRREYEEEKRRGVRRVDFLMGYTTFAGISPTTQEADLWQIILMRFQIWRRRMERWCTTCAIGVLGLGGTFRTVYRRAFLAPLYKMPAHNWPSVHYCRDLPKTPGRKSPFGLFNSSQKDKTGID
ncbi:hypothetical protein GGX14DRAFT_674411 [Mycena pura]|uniref:DUF6699 domain-containing protein n=1 Tax=Mycena pura TaxID=153505 RepID=A0AAD6V2P1_9AGAR|nr:hypothetical protein GGX14DRAFT_674411 [Mycena pura]